MKNTARLVGFAGIGILLLACGGPGTVTPVPFASADAYYAQGRVEHAARRFAEARRAWEQALQVDPTHAEARNGMAVLQAEQGDYGTAISLWRALLHDGTARSNEDRAFLVGNLGYALYLGGEREEALRMLKQACVLDPYRPLAWERLAAVLETLGHTELAVKMMKQARTLRVHDIRDDYALSGGAVPALPPATPQRVTPWPADMDRTELRHAGAVIEVHRVAAAPARAAPADVAAEPPAAGEPARIRLEVANGNGVRGMAAAFARDLRGPQWKSVRLTNVKPFTVPVTRIEYRIDPGTEQVARALARRLGLPAPQALPHKAAQPSDLRIVLGWDRRAGSAAAGEVSVQGARRAP